MNHTNTKRSIAAHTSEYASIFGTSPPPSAPPHILGETNSLYNQGRPGLSNTFGAALWALDFLAHCAAEGFGRVHFHMGTNYRYAAWQPVATNITTLGTKAPYYGHITAAAFLGDTARHDVAIAEIPLETTDGREAAYAAYSDGRLARLLIINMQAHNYTTSGTRGGRKYAFAVGGEEGAAAYLGRLLANGSDAVTGVTWDGWSYAHELAGGRPVRLANVTTGETVSIRGGQVTVEVPDSSAAVVQLPNPSVGMMVSGRVGRRRRIFG
jgi:hypothetical protein